MPPAILRQIPADNRATRPAFPTPPLICGANDKATAKFRDEYPIPGIYTSASGLLAEPDGLPRKFPPRANRLRRSIKQLFELDGHSAFAPTKVPDFRTRSFPFPLVLLFALRVSLHFRWEL